MLARSANLSLKAKGLAIGIWIALTITGICGAANLDKHLTTSLEIPGSQSAEASKVLDAYFSENRAANDR